MTRVGLTLAAGLLSAQALAAPPLHPPLPPPRPRLEAAPPLPPPRPDFEAGPKPAETPAPAPAEPGVCAAVTTGRAIGVALPAIPGENGCGVAAPVRMSGVRLRSGAELKLTPDAVVSCDMAGEVADFLDGEIARLDTAGEGRVVEVRHAGAYECRGANRVVGAKLSEHATGNAIDLRTFRFKDGRTLTIGTDRAAAWSGIKDAACQRFGTVLGPGADPEHKDHLHLDRRARRSTAICQWVLE